jgi:hypothetical protein
MGETPSGSAESITGNDRLDVHGLTGDVGIESIVSPARPFRSYDSILLLSVPRPDSALS